MLENRILYTLRFFALQGVPLTLFELHQYLLTDVAVLKEFQTENFELKSALPERHGVSIGTLTQVLVVLVNARSVTEMLGYYTLGQDTQVIIARWRGHRYGVLRQRLIRRYTRLLRHVPFVRGVALAGSQSFGVEKEGSYIDLFIVTAPHFLWVARTAVTFTLQILGVRRHGTRIANRFCLNHYTAGVRQLAEQNLYTALEYAKLRSLVYANTITSFLQTNKTWIQAYFPNFQPLDVSPDRPSILQRSLEFFINNRLGLFFEQQLGAVQRRRIHTEAFVVVRDNELSFHPNSKQEKLLADFFANESVSS